MKNSSFLGMLYDFTYDLLQKMQHMWEVRRQTQELLECATPLEYAIDALFQQNMCKPLVKIILTQNGVKIPFDSLNLATQKIVTEIFNNKNHEWKRGALLDIISGIPGQNAPQK